MSREKNLETCLVIATGLLLFWFIYEVKVLLIIAFVIGIIGVFINPLAKWVNWFWYKLADVLGMIVPKILLTLVFFVFLFPVALIYRMFNKDTLQLQKRGASSSYWVERGHQFINKDLEQIW